MYEYKNLGLWKNLFEERKIFACGKLSLMKKKSCLVEKFFDRGKIMVLSLWIKQMLVLKPLTYIYISKPGGKT